MIGTDAVLPDSRSARLLLLLLTAFLVSYLLPAMPFLSGTAVNSASRFAIAAGGAMIVVAKGWAVRPANWHTTTYFGAAWAALCLLSFAWSWAPLLTGVKGLLACALFTTAFLGGAQLGRLREDEGAQYFPWFVLGSAWVLATLSGLGGGADSYMGQMGFRGGTSNENMFASAAATVAFPMTEFLRGRMLFRGRSKAWIPAVLPWVWGAAVFLSGSRGGMLVYLVAGLVWWLAVRAARGTPWIPVSMAVLVTVGAVAGVEPMSSAMERFIYKQTAEGTRDVFYSRRSNWEESAAAIALVGPLGAGFGVSADQVFSSEGFSWTTTVGYGREHGSAWLAIREQLGVPGQVVFALIGLSTLALSARALRKVRLGKAPAAAGVLAGLALGLWAVSFFEAWTVAPGSPESGFFWLALGQASGLVTGRGPSRETVRA